MNREKIEKLGKAMHTSVVGKTIRVDWLYCFREDDQSHDLEGPFEVVVEDLEHVWQCKHYDPNWMVTPSPGQAIPEDGRTFWCCPVSYSVDADRWEIKYEEVEKAPHYFNVSMSGMARMRGVHRLKAPNEEEARREALTHIGDVHWEYDGMDDDTVEVDGVSGE